MAEKKKRDTYTLHLLLNVLKCSVIWLRDLGFVCPTQKSLQSKQLGLYTMLNIRARVSLSLHGEKRLHVTIVLKIILWSRHKIYSCKTSVVLLWFCSVILNKIALKNFFFRFSKCWGVHGLGLLPTQNVFNVVHLLGSPFGTTTS